MVRSPLRHAVRVAAVSVVFAVTLPAPPALADDVTPPVVTIAVPAAAQAFLPGDLTFSGNADDDVSVASVDVAIEDQLSGQWRQLDGTWGSQAWLSATLDAPGAASTGWSFTWAGAPEGRYLLNARGTDGGGNVDADPPATPFVVSSAANTKYLTLAFGRTQWVTTNSNCVRLANTVTLGVVASALFARGLAGTGNVVVNRTSSTTTPICLNHQVLSATWPQIRSLHRKYGWEFVSAGQTYADMTKLTPDQQRQESCGSLTAFTAHGLTRAWGLFAYPNDNWTVDTQAVVSTCFAYGRTYDVSNLNDIGTTGPPWFQKAKGVDGGLCNVAGLWCADPAQLPTAVGAYESPDALTVWMQPGPGQWAVVQGYRFVTGSRLNKTGQGWDCTNPDWRYHWTTRTELYCINDYLAAIGRIPSDVVVTDPATVAEAWGRPNPAG